MKDETKKLIKSALLNCIKAVYPILVSLVIQLLDII